MLLAEGEIFPTIKVKVFPVKDYWRSRVSFDSRKAAMLLVLEDNDAITLPNVVKDWFMFFNYWKWSFPMVSPLFIFYEPAKSHKFSLAFCFIVKKYLKHTLWVRMCRLQQNLKYGMWSATFCVHWSLTDKTIFFTSFHQLQTVQIMCNCIFRQTLYENSVDFRLMNIQRLGLWEVLV